jgi:DNA primase catalytic subunit
MQFRARALKKEAKRLIAVLLDYFDIEEKTVFIYFSGNKDFHLIVSNNSFNPLYSEARSDILSYN